MRIVQDMTARPVKRQTRGFTLVEILTSILIIGIVAGLLVVGLRVASSTARSAVDRQTVSAIKVGISQFQQDFGFAPPMVKDQAQNRELVVVSGGVLRISVYNPSVAADRAALTVPTLLPTADNPYRDNRYSEQSLAYYLAGGLGLKRTADPNSPVIDGVEGPGLYKPDTEGYFDIPKDIREGSSTSNRVGTKYESFVNLGGRAPTLVDAGETTGIRAVPPGYGMVLADRNGVAIRYYKWEGVHPVMVGRKSVEPTRNPVSIPTPDDRDIEKNPAARSAKWAVVAAGPNGVFGDEAIEVIGEKLGVAISSVSQIAKARQTAEADNIVEFGQ